MTAMPLLRNPIVPAGLVVAAVVGAAAATDPSETYRPLFAALIFANLALAVALSPRAAIVATFAFLPAMALLRRILIDDAGWSSQDPLLLVGPGVALVLVLRLLLVERRAIPTDTASTLVIALLAVATLGALNPSGGGLRAGVAGLLFLGVPLAWYMIGRELVDRGLVETLMKIVVAIGVLVAAYGLVQSEIGFPAWDEDWVDVGGYYALFIGTDVRPFASFASASEYLLFLSAASVFCLALWRARRDWRWLLPLPLLAAALFLGSGRTAFALGVVAVLAMAALGTRRPRRVLAVVAAGVALAVLGVTVIAPALTDSSDPLIRHQAEGIAHPFDPDRSTLRIHWDLFRGGVEEGIRHPLGLGTGVTNLAAELAESDEAKRKVTADVFSDRPNLETDIDLSNVFLSLGALGGLIYAALIAVVAWRVVRRYRRGRDPLVLGVIGLLVGTLGQWLTGGHYVLAPLTWLLIGWAARGEE